MRLTSIKLSGFKSFVDPTHFQVPGQLVGVVGPNGCGKSNIIDAVRWVLGESKASELRGESMQDVIFNGSTHRKPAGRSSVELIFDNSLGKAAGQWSQYGEIAVKRTLTRDGTSTYYINGQAVRRRDIQDIFLGTGLGPRAYAIIGQGMISRIIEARPEELRIFLEEAAGVSRYKERRRETENRIHDTHENLVRVDDILRELNANLEKLQAQAVVANKFHELQGDQEEKQKLLWLLRKNEAAAEQHKHFTEIEKTQLDLEEQTARLRHVELELDQMRQAHYAVGDRMHQAQGHLYQTNAEIGSLEAQIKFVIESRSRLQVQLQSLTAQRDQWQHQSVQLQDSLDMAEIEVEELAMRAEQASETALSQHDTLPALELSWRQAQVSTTESRATIMQMQQQIELESAHQRNASNILNTLAARKERLQQEKHGLALPDSSHLENLQYQLEEKQQVMEDLTLQLEQAQHNLPDLEEQRKLAQQEVQRDAAELAQLEARLLALKQLQEKVQTQGKVQPWLDKHELGSLPKLWQKLHIEGGWETALEAVLRERTAALEMSNLDWAKAFFNDAPPAKLAVFSPQIQASQQLAEPGLKPFIDLLQLNDAGVRGVLQDWLAHIYVAADLTSAFLDRSKLPPGASFVTREGHLIARSSVRFYAADSEQDGVLGRQQEIDNLGKQCRARQLLAEQAKARAVRAEALYSQASQQLQELRQRVASLTQTTHSLQIETMKLAEVQSRFNQRSTQIGNDLAEIAAQESEQQQARAESEQKFEMLDMELAQVQEAHEDGQTIYLEKEQQLNQARQRLRDLELAAQEAAFAEKSHRSKMEELRRNISTAREQSAQLFASMQQGQLELETMNDQAAQAGLQDLLDRRSDQERALADARHELDQLTQQLRTHEDNKTQTERSLQPQRDRIVELQLKEQAARLAQEQFAEQLRNFEVDEAKLSEKLHADLRPSYLQGEVTRLNNAIAALGAVNMAALDELKQASERKTFLDAQHADLSEAITTLQDAIHKIDIETRALLQDTFDKVNHHFAELFPILFGGGQARLIMTGDEILDSGVQVMAQPPGKKNATIHLLSGGEKALTATALVFSMFQLNPAPFCLLDEVDAPLDDSNTERFCNMVKRMSVNTQFLFISHNKIAMEMAQQLIGVTMQEQGVSRIVAVDMESAVHFATEVQAA
ncbi:MULTISPECIES: chromosome segregation protein SMC [unclassified Undibacterium]|uniref:chromosome segregation protein SMC n=2 Tax=Pseudomonadota TaxID=1224 RepID=UPI002AC8A7A0|nr:MULTISPECIES: chromosome segregation protein SMC [unclassified Undibacterium]MEB0138556.1 chromosome segregation protein SMC [Undibacterium sp. CCC2.1]MEB0171380.1 chromosome segregation protein SMC [Undibacterium sp. CCC1.1]MEB0175320.1 chromosome segregation protein SMC [Undibacterium sp. CCC3.4]MEB0214576.1 chromosome segregation protein SMC [Undibacterium sp. 5I2]WPX43049.1 chromosome segregation protein SMC [Undibacterium sp. CCC3.4]